METNLSDYDPASLTLFKSYYVVWKQQEDEKHKGKIVLFKSYYVVWKPRGHLCFECAYRGV